jgi:uncharacterized membrane protein
MGDDLEDRVDYDKKKSDRTTSERDDIDLNKKSNWDVNLNLAWWQWLCLVVIFAIILLIVAIVYLPDSFWTGLTAYLFH